MLSLQRNTNGGDYHFGLIHRMIHPNPLYEVSATNTHDVGAQTAPPHGAFRPLRNSGPDTGSPEQPCWRSQAAHATLADDQGPS